jgi:hypothetical protein
MYFLLYVGLKDCFRVSSQYVEERSIFYVEFDKEKSRVEVKWIAYTKAPFLGYH